MRDFAVLIACLGACGTPTRPQLDVDVDAAELPVPLDAYVEPDEEVYVYAHSPSALYQVDPLTFAVTKIGDFSYWTLYGGMITDLAIDQSGRMIGLSYSSIHEIDPKTAVTTKLADLPGGFNGLSFMPADAIGKFGPDVLVGTSIMTSSVYEIDPTTGAATEIGNMGNYYSSGDLVAVKGLGIMQTVVGAGGSDELVRLNPPSFQATKIGPIGFIEVWGIGFWKNRIYGFTNQGDFITIDPQTGAGTLIQKDDTVWYGAAVTTIAPVIF